MKGSELVLKVLNEQLADELTAVNQYMVHAGMCNNWGYEKLHGLIEKRAIEEMKHAEALIDRILFSEWQPHRQQAQQDRHRRGCPHSAQERSCRRSGSHCRL